MFEQIGVNIFRPEIRSETLDKLSKLKAELARKHPNGSQLTVELVRSVTVTLQQSCAGTTGGPRHDGRCVLVDISDRRWSQKASELKQKGNERS